MFKKCTPKITLHTSDAEIHDAVELPDVFQKAEIEMELVDSGTVDGRTARVRPGLKFLGIPLTPCRADVWLTFRPKANEGALDSEENRKIWHDWWHGADGQNDMFWDIPWAPVDQFDPRVEPDKFAHEVRLFVSLKAAGGKMDERIGMLPTQHGQILKFTVTLLCD